MLDGLATIVFLKSMLHSSHPTQNVHYAIRDIILEAQKLIPKDKKILPLNIGDPLKFDFKTPRHIQDAVRESLAETSAYAPSEGLEEACLAVAQFQSQFGIPKLTAADILITSGGSEAISLILASVLNPGDSILIPYPGYPAYEAQINLCQAKAKPYYLDEGNEWQIDPDEIESLIDSKTRAIVIINPNNPTGAVLTQNVLKEVLLVAQKHNLLVIADEQVYPFYVFEGEMTMCASLGIDVPIISIGSMSKTYLVPGYRIGWIVFNDLAHNLAEVKETIFKLKRVNLCSPHPLQKAVKPALGGSHAFLSEVKEKLINRRNLLTEKINRIEGLSLVKPKGAFYAFVKIEFPIQSDKNFVLKLAQKTGILCVPGEGIGQKEGTHHFRLVFLPPEKMLEEALDNLEAFVKSYGQIPDFFIS